MNTKVKISQTNDPRSIYQHYYIQLLRYRYESSDYLEVFGTIMFQQGGLSGNDEWYAMKMECISDSDSAFADCARILKFIKTHRDDCNIQPKEVIALIGGEEYVNYEGDFIPKSYNGMKKFNVVSSDGSLYMTLIAASETLAMAKLRKRKLDGQMTLVFDKIVSF